VPIPPGDPNLCEWGANVDHPKDLREQVVRPGPQGAIRWHVVARHDTRDPGKTRVSSSAISTRFGATVGVTTDEP